MKVYQRNSVFAELVFVIEPSFECYCVLVFLRARK
nr:MAG TPA: hypothetical protein [Caudoviricetes sp.]